MRKIYKYPLFITYSQLVNVPQGSVFLSVTMQKNTPVCYFMVWADIAEMSSVRFKIFGTGHPIDESDIANMRFVGTLPMHYDDLMWHVFIEM